MKFKILFIFFFLISCTTNSTKLINKAPFNAKGFALIYNEEDFNNKITWNTGVDESGTAITTETCPHSEITWTKVKAEMDKL